MRYSSYSFSTPTLDGGDWLASRPGRALPPGKGPPVPIVQEAGWASETVWTQRLEEKPFAPAGDRIILYCTLFVYLFFWNGAPGPLGTCLLCLMGNPPLIFKLWCAIIVFKYRRHRPNNSAYYTRFNQSC
jgi:hypothetical protein